MDVSTIATEVLAILLPSLVKIKEGVFKSIGADIWGLIKKAFRTTDRNQKIIKSLEVNPNDLKLQQDFTMGLIELLEKDPHLVAEITKLLDKLKIENISVKVNNVKSNKNMVIANTIFAQNGNIVIGDGVLSEDKLE